MKEKHKGLSHTQICKSYTVLKKHIQTYRIYEKSAYPLVNINRILLQTTDTSNKIVWYYLSLQKYFVYKQFMWVHWNWLSNKNNNLFWESETLQSEMLQKVCKTSVAKHKVKVRTPTVKWILSLRTDQQMSMSTFTMPRTNTDNQTD